MVWEDARKFKTVMMETVPARNTDHGRQYLLLGAISAAVLLLFLGLFAAGSSSFHPYFGDVQPLAVAVISVLLGFLLLKVHLSNGWLMIWRKGNRQGLILAAGAAVLLGGIIIVADLIAPFPPDINVAFPESLLFYPAIGFVVEILFHLLPLTLLLVLLTKGILSWRFDRVIWPVIFLVSMLEPLYQVVPAFGQQAAAWFDIYVGIHIFLINLTQLWLFKRYDFISMYLFRLVYYLIWHIGWGYLRLEILF